MGLNKAFPARGAARSAHEHTGDGARRAPDARATRERGQARRNGRPVAPTGGNVARSARPGSARARTGPEPTRT